MEQRMNFDANDQLLSEVFFETKSQFRVPRYQRPYAWLIDHVTDFWEDLLQNEQPYYLGSFIFNIEYAQNDNCQDIIDGQQRLLTITIFCAVLRDLAKNIDSEYSALIQRQDIAYEDWEGKSCYRIIAAETLEGYFKNNIQKNDGDITLSQPATAEEKRVKDNYIFLKEKVSSELDRFPSNTAKLDVIKDFRTKIRNLMVIDIEINNEEDAYDIFETTNARGMELSVGDLLKNLIFKNIPAGENRDFAKDVWKSITKNIEETNTELRKFIRYFWLSKYNLVQEKRLYKEIKNNVASSKMQNFLQDLLDDSILFNTLLEGDENDFATYGDHCKQIFQSIFALRLMGVSQCYVLLMAILRNFNKLGFDPFRTFQLIENFTFQYSLICKLPGNKVEKIYSKYALEIEKTAKDGPSEKIRQNLNSIFDQLKNELYQAAPSESLFLENFPELSYKNSTENRMLIKYILEKINSHFKKTDEYRINFDAVNIEHLLPQNPDDEWHLTKSQIREYVNKLGNLTLLSTKLNSKIQNAVIGKKLPLLNESELDITKILVAQLIELDCNWGETQITKRQEELGNISFHMIWKLSA